MVGRKIFVGRRSELREMSRLLDQARESIAGLVVIEGPAGMGKTALLHRFIDAVDDAVIVRASGDELEMGLAYGVLHQLIDGKTERRPGEVPATDVDDTEGDLTDTAVDPFNEGARLLELIDSQQQSGPVIVALDDMQWADLLSLTAMAFAFRRLLKDRVLVVVALRDVDDAALPDGFRRLLVGENATRLVLSGLTNDDLRRLSTELTGSALSPRTAARLHEHTDGNPLYLRALLEQLPAEALRHADGPLPAPRSFELLVLARLAARSAETRQFVVAASVLGRRSELHLVTKLSGVQDPLRALDEADEAGLLVERPASRTVEFPHPLLHAAVYQQLGVTERIRLHERAAEHVVDERTQLHHRLHAATGPDLALARDLARFARQRVSVGDSSAGGEHMAAAAGLAAGTAEGEQFAVEATECELMTGDVDDPAARSAQLRTFRVTAWRDYVLARLAVVEGHMDEAERLLHDAWHRCADPPVAARIAGQLAWLSVARDDGNEAVVWSERALEGGAETTDLGHLVHLVSLGMTGQIEERLASLTDLPDPADATVPELDALLGRARLRKWSGDLRGAYDDLTGLRDVAAGRSMAFQVITNLVLGHVEYLLGRWDDAVVHSALAVSLAVDAEQSWLTPICHAVASFVPAARGQWERASAQLDKAARHVTSPTDVIPAIYLATAGAHLAAARNDHDGVIKTLRPLLARRPGSVVFEPGVILRWQDLLVEALAATGQLDEATTVLDQLEVRACAAQRRSTTVAAARARGSLLAARHKYDDAIAAFEWGLEQAEDLDIPFDRAILELAAGSCIRRAGRRNAAAARLREASAIFERLGAWPYLKRTDRELAACGRRYSRRPETMAPDLTPQELAVARLAANGMSNKQIARDLFISVKTVEYHLSHVYTKMQLSSRVQLANRLGHD